MGTEFIRGAVVGNGYRLEREIGRGGWSVVWAATHVKLQQPRAIKILSAPNEDKRARFLREGRAGATIEHPNLVPVLDFFEIGETLALVLPLLEGETLETRLAREERLTLTEAAQLITPVVSAVLHAHEKGVVHRDLKPDNIFLEIAKGALVPRVLDFGVAKLRDHEDEVQKTRTGVMLGTAGYMAPEQLLCVRDVDGRADVWALGAILYECLAGFRPVEPSSANDQMYNAFKTRSAISIVPLATLEPDFPRDLTELVMAMLAVDREDRPTLERVREVLARLGDPSRPLPDAPAPARPTTLTAPVTKSARWRLAGVVSAGSVVFIALTAFFVSHGRPAPPGSAAPRESPALGTAPASAAAGIAPARAEAPALSGPDTGAPAAPPVASPASTGTTNVKPKRGSTGPAPVVSARRPGKTYDPLGEL